MRARTDVRRQKIIDTAATLFCQTGYERASMSQIAALVGGSKTTLYGYFKSKEDLFAAVMYEAMEVQSQALVAMIDPATTDPRAALIAFGRAYLALILSPDVVAVTRIGIAEGGNNAIGVTLYERGPGRGWGLIAEHLAGWIDRGVLRKSPSIMTAFHLKGLLEAGVVEPRLYGATQTFDPNDAVDAAIDVFFRAYGA